jgi:nucleoside-diphosphate kinase
MAVEQTFIFIKPDGVSRRLVGQVLARFEARGLVISELKKMQVSSALPDKHYAEHVDKPFYPGLKQYVTSGPVVAAIIEGENAVSVVRAMCGATDPCQAVPGTIRGDFALSLDANIIHSSDSVESAKREIQNFF